MQGTNTPIWLDGAGKLPNKTGEEVQLTARLKKRNNCNYKEWKINVKKCRKGGEEFFLYKLKPIERCPYIYCAGKDNLNHKTSIYMYILSNNGNVLSSHPNYRAV